MTLPASHGTPTGRPTGRPTEHPTGQPTGRTTAPTGVIRRPVGFLDWLLALAALLSVVTLAWVLFWNPHDPWHDRLIGADAAISALFLLRWVWRLAAREDRWLLTKAWWELIAIVPLITPWAGRHTLPLVVIGLARVARAVDRGDDLYGDFITIWLIRHFSDPIIEAIKRPITVAVLDEVIDVVKTGTYAENVKKALDENRDELEAMVLDLIREDRTTGKLKYLPFHDDIVTLVADTVLRLVDGALEDPRTTELISDVISHSATQLRQAIREEL